MKRFILGFVLGTVFGFVLCAVAPLAVAQQVILTTREQQALKALMGPSGTLEQLLLTETSTHPLSSAGVARVMADSVTHTLLCSFNGGAYSACTGSASLWLDITTYGAAIGASVAVNNAAFQDAHDAAIAGQPIYIPPGVGCYDISVQINVTKSVTWFGGGSGQVGTAGTSGSCVRLTNATQHGFAVNSTDPVLFANFAIVSSVAVSGDGIRLTSPGVVGGLSGAQKTRISNMQFLGLAGSTRSVSSLFAIIENNTFWNCVTTCITWENTQNGDQGDTVITGNTFFGPITANGFIWRSGGGIRLTNNKFLGFAGAINIDPLDSTQDFIIANNSIESFDAIGIQVTRSSGAAAILYLQITGNQISRLLGSGGVATNWGIAFGTNDATYVTDVIIAQNFISDVDVGIKMGGGTRYRIVDNELLRITTGSAIGIEIVGSAAEVIVGSNRYVGVTNPISGTPARYPMPWEVQIQRPGAFYNLTFPVPTAGTECLQINSAGVISPTGAACSTAGTGILSLNGLTGATQTFTNDTNLQIASAGTAHVLTWASTLSRDRGGWGQDTSAATGAVSFNAGTPVFSNVLGTPGDLLFSAATNAIGTNSKLTWDNVNIQLNVTNNASGLPLPPADSRFRVASASGSPSNIAADAWAAQGALVCRRANTTPAAPTALTTNDPICAIIGQGYEEGTPGYSGSAASLGFFASGAFTATSWPTFITLATTPSGSTTLTEAVRITSAQNVAIGTTTATQRLTVTPAVGIGVASTTTGQLVLFNAANANTFTIQPGVTAASTTVTLPTGDGAAGTCLSTNGSNVWGWANCSSGGTGLTSLGGQTGATQTFAKVDDTNVTLAIGSAVDVHTFTLGWTGTLGAARGGFGADMSAASGALSFNSGTRVVNNILGTPGQLIFSAATNAMLTDTAFGVDNTNKHVYVTTNVSTLPPVASLTAVRQRWASASGVATAVQIDAYGNEGEYFCRRANGTPAAPTTLVANNVICSLFGQGYDGTVYTSGQVAINMVAGGTWTGASRPAYLNFVTTPAGSTATATRMTITDIGRVGIGTTLPQTEFEVAGTARLGINFTTMPVAQFGGLLIGDYGGGALGEIQLLTSASASGFGFRFIGNSATGGLRLQRRASSASWSNFIEFAAAGSMQVIGLIESTSGGFKFPDATTQTSAACVLSGTCAWTGAHSWAQQAALTLLPFGASAGNTGEIRFRELVANGVSYVGFKAPDAIATNIMWQLPIADGTANQCLKTDGFQQLGWSGCASGITGSGSAGQMTFWTGAATQSGSPNATWDDTFKRLTLDVPNTSPSYTDSRPLFISAATSGARTASTPFSFTEYILSNSYAGFLIDNTDSSTSSSAQLGNATSVTGMVRVSEQAGFTGTGIALGGVYQMEGSTSSAERAAVVAYFDARSGSGFGGYGLNTWGSARAGTTPNGVTSVQAEVFCGAANCGTTAVGIAAYHLETVGTSVTGATNFLANTALGAVAGVPFGRGFTNAFVVSDFFPNDAGFVAKFKITADGVIDSSVPTDIDDQIIVTSVSGGTQGAGIVLIHGGAANGTKHLRANGSNFQILNTAGTPVLVIGDAGGITDSTLAGGGSTSACFNNNGTLVRC